MNVFRCAIDTIAKHHALSLAVIKECGGAENFFKMFPNLDYDGFLQPDVMKMWGPVYKNAKHWETLKTRNQETTLVLNHGQV